MNKQLLQKAITRADAIQKLYRKLEIYRTLMDKKAEEKTLDELNFVIELENEIYNEFKEKDFEEYYIELIKRNPSIYFYNINRVLYGDFDYNPEARVYQKLMYMDGQRTFYPEFTTKSVEVNQAVEYLIQSTMIKSLNFFINNLANNHFYNSNFVYHKIRYQLAYLYPEIEKDFLNGKVSKELSYPNATQINFALYDDESFFYYVCGLAETYLNDFTAFLSQKIEYDIEYFDSDKYKKRMPIDEIYLRYLIFLLGDRDIIDEWIFNLEPYKELHPNLNKFINVLLNEVVADTERFFGDIPKEETESDGVTR